MTKDANMVKTNKRQIVFPFFRFSVCHENLVKLLLKGNQENSLKIKVKYIVHEIYTKNLMLTKLVSEYIVRVTSVICLSCHADWRGIVKGDNSYI